MAVPNPDDIAVFASLITGWDISTEELVTAGERIENMRQAFNLRDGIDITQNKLADRLLGRPPHKEGPIAGVSVDAETMVKDYVTAMHWDPKTGKPGRKRLLELGLEDVADELGV
jgi:aldehyde:ferredoxin oxidoreductase